MNTDKTLSVEQRLRVCEQVLLDHMEEFVKVGLALKEIKDNRLYEADGHDDWGEYLKSANNRFGLSRSYADELIGSAELRKKLPDIVPATGGNDGMAGWTERSIRQLKKLKTDEQAKRVAAQVVQAVKDDGEKLTSTLVGKFVDEALGVTLDPCCHILHNGNRCQSQGRHRDPNCYGSKKRYCSLHEPRFKPPEPEQLDFGKWLARQTGELSSMQFGLEKWPANEIGNPKFNEQRVGFLYTLEQLRVAVSTVTSDDHDESSMRSGVRVKGSA